MGHQKITKIDAKRMPKEGFRRFPGDTRDSPEPQHGGPKRHFYQGKAMIFEGSRQNDASNMKEHLKRKDRRSTERNSTETPPTLSWPESRFY